MAWVGVVTNDGRAMLDSFAQGGHELSIDSATVGTGIVADANLRIQTAVSGEITNASIVSVKEISGGGTKYKIQIGPATASIGAYVAHQVGLWGSIDGGAEKLLLLMQDSETGISIPLESVSPAFTFSIFAAMEIDNTEDLTVNIDETAYVTMGTMNTALNKKVDKEAIANNLTTGIQGKVLDARQGKVLKELIDGMVSGVKGNAEADYRHGDVNITPENIGAMAAEPSTIELKPSVGSGFGGYIDFHFNGSSADYTTRLIEDASGQLTLLGSLILSSALGVPSGGTGAEDAAGARANLHAMLNPDTSAPQYGTGNFNDAPVGFSAWYGPNCVNAPFQAWASVLTMNFIVGYVQQIAFSWLGNQIAYRVCDNGTWNTWKYITLS